MSNPYAMVNSSNVVYDVTIWDGDTGNWTPPSGFTCVGMGTFPVGIGMTYNSTGVGIGTTSACKWIG